MACGAEAAHGIDHGIGQAGEEKAEVAGFQQFAFRSAGTIPHLGSCNSDFGEALTEIIKQLPTGELLFVDLVLGAGLREKPIRSDLKVQAFV
jgi:hypothetical protein